MTTHASPRTTEGLEWADRPDGTEEAVLRVPMDYRGPERGEVSLTLRRRRATSAQRRGVLLAINGGPGGDTGDGSRIIDRLPASLNAHYDLIGLDPRGTEPSTPLYADVVTPIAPFDSRPPSSAYVQIARDMAAREAGCQRAGGDYRRHVTTANTARDIDRIRIALGEDRINLVGYAFGTAVVAAYGSLFPTHLDRAVLDSCIHPDWTWRDLFLAQARSVHASVQQWAEWVAARHEQYGLGRAARDVMAGVESVVGRLEVAGDVALRTLYDGMVGNKSVDRSAWDELARTTGALAGLPGDLDGARQLIAGTSTWRPQDAEGSRRIAVIEAVTMETSWPADLDVYWADMHHHTVNYPYGFGVLRAQPWVGTFRSAPPAEDVIPAARDGYPTPLVVQAEFDPFDAVEGGHAMAGRLEAPMILVEDSGEHEVFGLVGNAAVDEIVLDYLTAGVLPGQSLTRVASAVPRPSVPADDELLERAG